MWLFVLSNRSRWTEYINKRVTNVEIVLLLLYVLVGIATIFSVEPEISRFGMSNRYEGFFALLAYFSLFLFAFRLVNMKHHKKILRGLVGAGVIVAVYGILQHYFLDFLPRNSVRMGSSQIYGLFDNPNFFGSYLVLVISISIMLFLISKGNKSYYFYLGSSVLFFIAIIFTYTRSALVGLFATMLFLTLFVILNKKHLWRRWTIVLVLFISIFISIDALGDGKFINKIATAFDDTQKIITNNSDGHEGSSRWFIWRYTFPLIEDYFWTGSGPDTLYYVFPNDNRELVSSYLGNEIVVDKAHNEYLQIAVTLGVPALVVYLTFLSVILFTAYRALQKIKTDETIYIIHCGIIASIVGYLVQAFFNISVVTVAPFFWVLLGLCFHASYTYLDEKNCKKAS